LKKKYYFNNVIFSWIGVIEAIFHIQLKCYKFRVGYKFIEFFPSDIIRIEADGSYSTIYTIDKKYIISRNLSFVEKKLSGWGFIRIHRSHIINITHIRAFEKKTFNSVRMSDNKIILIPRRNRKRISKKIPRKYSYYDH